MRTAKLLRKICAGLSAAAIIICSMAALAFAENVPRNLEVSIDTIEEKVGTLRGGDVVDLPVRIANNVGLYSLSLIFQVEGDWNFMQGNPVHTRVAEFGGVTYSFVDSDILVATITCSTIDSYQGNGELMCIPMNMGNHVTEGKYAVKLLQSYGNSQMEVMTEKASRKYGPDCFAKLNAGGIQWISDKPKTQPPIVVPPQMTQPPVQPPQHNPQTQAQTEQPLIVETQPPQGIVQPDITEMTVAVTELPTETTVSETTAETTDAPLEAAVIASGTQTKPKLQFIQYDDVTVTTSEQAADSRESSKMNGILIAVTVILGVGMVIAVGADLIVSKKLNRMMTSELDESDDE